MMPEGWKEILLGSVSELITKGTTPTTNGQTYEQTGIPFLRVENITEIGTLDLSNVKFISEETHALLARSHTQPNDVLISIAGALGRCCVLPETLSNANMNQAIALVRLGNSGKGHVLSNFLKYQIHGELVQNQIRLVGAQQAQANLNLKQVGELQLLLPPLPEQRKIAAILSSVDNAIEATQAVIDQLQVVKKAMMSELLTRGLPGRHTRFKQTEIGEVPEEWEVISLGDLMQIQGGYAFKSSLFGNEGIPVIRMSNIKRGLLDLSESVRVLPHRLAGLEDYALKEGDVVLGLSGSLGPTGSLGNYAKVREADLPAYLNQRVARLVSRETGRLCNEFIFTIISSEKFRIQIEALSTSLAQANVSPKQIESLRWCLPPIREQREISYSITAIDWRIIAEADYLHGVKNLKSALSSALLTGEIRVQPDEASP